MTAEDREAVGSVGEEARKLLHALEDWARDYRDVTGGRATAGSGGLADVLSAVDEHVLTRGEDCRYCPLCRTISVVRGTSPEVRAHLTSAATSLLTAVGVFMESAGARDRQERRDNPAGARTSDPRSTRTGDDEDEVG